MLETLTVTLLAAFVISIVTTIVARKVGIRLGIADKPGGRRRHKGTISRLGALPIFSAFVLAVALAYVHIGRFQSLLDDTVLRGLLLGAVGVFVFGLVDDKFELSGRVQFACQVAIASIPVLYGALINQFSMPAGGPVQLIAPVAIIVTVLWFMGMMNTVNFTDGVDGLASVMALVGTLTMAYYMFNKSEHLYSIVAVALAGALAGFLVFNMQPASIFLGSGALFLGYVMAYLAMLVEVKLSLLLIVMSLPIADTAWQIFDRIRNGRNPMVGDRGHLHLRLVDMGWSARSVCLLYMCISAALAAFALFMNDTIVRYIGFAGVVTVVIGVLARLAKDAKETIAVTGSYPQGTGSNKMPS
jgi:UDP-GlcNAc:undecaprenyl-phosphate GlcNAc-1-phosphate transferase